MSITEEDIGESPIRKTNETSWQAGESANPAGRAKGSRNAKPRSKMRTTLAKLYTLEKDAIDVIRESLVVRKNDKGEKIEVDKTQLETAKYVVNKIESLNNSCLKEEMAILGVKTKDQEGGDMLEKNQDVEPAVQSNFSMNMEETTSKLKH